MCPSASAVTDAFGFAPAEAWAPRGLSYVQFLLIREHLAADSLEYKHYFEHFYFHNHREVGHLTTPLLARGKCWEFFLKVSRPFWSTELEEVIDLPTKQQGHLHKIASYATKYLTLGEEKVMEIAIWVTWEFLL